MVRPRRTIVARFALALAFALVGGAAARAQQPADTATAAPQDDGTYEKSEIVDAVAGFFGVTTEAAAKVVEKVFADRGRPNAYIAGEEGSGAFIAGLRYGKGELTRKNEAPVTVYWQGPSVGFDFGGNASKTFVLVYHLGRTEDIFRRFPGPEATGYFIAGIGVNYQQNGDIVLAPMRTGVGFRGGVNLGYLHYSRERHWLPL